MMHIFISEYWDYPNPLFVAAYYVIFLSYKADKPSFFDDPIQSVLAMFIMSLSEFGDTYEQFHYTAHPNISKVSFSLMSVFENIFLDYEIMKI